MLNMNLNGPPSPRSRLCLLAVALLASASATALVGSMSLNDGGFSIIDAAHAQDDDGPDDAGPGDDGPDDDGPVGPDDDGPAGPDDDGPAAPDDDGPPVDDRIGDDDATAGADDRGAGQRLADDEALDDRGNIVRRSEVIAIQPTPQALENARRLGFTIERQIALPALGFEAFVLRAPDRLQTREALRQLRARNPKDRFDYNHVLDFRPTISRQPPTIFEPKTRLREALSQRSDITIGLIDTEVDARHPALRGARLGQRDFLPSHREIPEHGTAVASLLLDQREGLLPRSRILVASIFKDSVRGNVVGSVSELVQALDWLTSEKVTVINMSLAGPPNELLRLAVERTLARGHVIVAAVGNDGPNAERFYPASYPGVLGITAIDNKGRIYRRAAQGPQVDFAAPGVDVPLAHPRGYGLFTGTSFAAPYATAVVAAGLSRPDPKAAGLWIEQLSRRAIDLGPRGRDSVYGMGLISLEPQKR